MPHSILRVHSTSLFERSFRKLPVNIQRLAEKKDKWFRYDAFDSRLHTHKLKGELEGYWSYYINYQYRILFRFLNADEVVYYDIGTHDIYRQKQIAELKKEAGGQKIESGSQRLEQKKKRKKKREIGDRLLS